MAKRMRDYELDSDRSYKRSRYYEPAIAVPIAPSYAPPSSILGRARSYRKYGTSSRRRSKYGFRKSSYGNYGIKNRGPYARVNRISPELKSHEIQKRFFPVALGNMVGEYSWTGTSPIPANQWSGSAKGGYVEPLNVLGTGTDIYNRIGRKILSKSVLLNCTWRLRNPENQAPPIANTPPLPVSIRTILVWDKAPNGVLINIDNFLSPVDTQIGNAVSPISPNNLQYRDRFRTLWDCRDTLSPGGDSLRQYEKYIKINRETIYSNSGDTIGNLTTGALYLIFLSDMADPDAVGDPSYTYYRPMVSFSSRFRYTDA